MKVIKFVLYHVECIICEEFEFECLSIGESYQNYNSQYILSLNHYFDFHSDIESSREIFEHYKMLIYYDLLIREYKGSYAEGSFKNGSLFPRTFGKLESYQN